MPDILAQALATPALVWVALAMGIAGLVYGFAGFGSALIFMPVAVTLLPPAVAVGVFSFSAIGSLITVLPGAWPAADKRQTLLMLGASLATLPIGVAALRLVPAETIQIAVAALTLITLGALLAGWRLPLGGGWPLRAGIGGLAGLTGGATGLNGPPVILFNLGVDQPISVTRANLACFLTLSSLLMLPMLAAQNVLAPATLTLGALLLPVYILGSWLGTRLFRPDHARTYRALAYILIAAAGLRALPLW